MFQKCLLLGKLIKHHEKRLKNKLKEFETTNIKKRSINIEKVEVTVEVNHNKQNFPLSNNNKTSFLPIFRMNTTTLNLLNLSTRKDLILVKLTIDSKNKHH